MLVMNQVVSLLGFVGLLVINVMLIGNLVGLMVLALGVRVFHSLVRFKK